MDIERVSYYHGSISRILAEQKLSEKPTGSFLLRKSLRNDDAYVISVVSDDKVLHYSVEKSDQSKMYSVSNGSEHKTPALVCEHYVCESSGLKTKLLHPVPCLSADQNSVNGSVQTNEVNYKHCEWFHGSISREEDSKRLSDAYFFNQKNGIFLVRQKSESKYVLSVVYKEKVHRYIINQDSTTKLFYIDERDDSIKFNSLDALLQYHMYNPPETTGLKCQLSMPCRRNPNDVKETDFEQTSSVNTINMHSNTIFTNVKKFASSLASELKSVLPKNSLDVAWSDTSDSSQCEVTREFNLSRHASLKLFNRQSFPKDSIGFFSPYRNSSPNSSRTSPIVPDLYISRDKIKLLEILGTGHFGCVKFAECQIVDKVVPCAVKMLSGSDVQANKKELLEEASVMQHLDHPYIVRLLAVCEPEAKEANLMIVLELAPLGTLKNFIKKQTENTFSEHKIMILMQQVCEGMAYLAKKSVIHRDLAARNLLLVTENFVKISDFGMSKILSNNDYYRASKPGSWPLRWYPPEALLYYKFSSKGDVWSFGITVWEVCSYGSRPYKGMRGREILDMLESEKRLQCPGGCSPGLYSLLLQCWAYEPDNRPSFEQLLVYFEKLLVS